VSAAREHAVTASELLDSIDRTQERLDALTDDQRLQMVATQGFTRVNRDLQWTIELATAHALAALALQATDDAPVGERIL
jgi:hypothetical protein